MDSSKAGQGFLRLVKGNFFKRSVDEVDEGGQDLLDLRLEVVKPLGKG